MSYGVAAIMLLMQVVNTARDHVAESEGGYPLIEVEWLVCTAWNEGVKHAVAAGVGEVRVLCCNSV
eukprot:COSAG02_NODE_9142_length_2314_cov_1.557562_3_plen_65_part_01